MHLDPVRKGLVKGPEDWRWSSYNNFALDKATVAACPIQIDDVRLPPGYRATPTVRTSLTVANLESRISNLELSRWFVTPRAGPPGAGIRGLQDSTRPQYLPGEMRIPFGRGTPRGWWVAVASRNPKMLLRVSPQVAHW